MSGEVGLLRQVAERRSGLHETAAAIGLDQAGGDLEQRRLARAVAADQAEPVGGRHRQRGAVEERRVAQGESDVLEKKERGSHARRI